MPAPGDQHKSYSANISASNPFENTPQRMNVYTAQEIASLQSRLDKQLGPEYISSRAGPGGQKVHYLAADKCINLANEVFGFSGWSSSIQNVSIDFVDENPNTGKVSLGLSVVMRVTLKNGAYHEDIGYGHIENAKGKAAAFEKAKKEGTTDALKRALRNFGNVLGNCIYDKDYLAKVTKVKAIPAKWDIQELHRHGDFVPIKKEPAVAPLAPKTESVPNIPVQLNVPNVSKKSPNEPLSMDLYNDFGSELLLTNHINISKDSLGDAFDEADFGEHDLTHPDEVVLEEEPAAQIQNNKRQSSDVQRQGYAAGGPPHAIPSHMVTPSKPPQQPYTANPPISQSKAALPVPADRITRPPQNQYTTPKPQTVTRSQIVPARPVQGSQDFPPPLPCDQMKAAIEPGTDSRGNASPSKSSSLDLDNQENSVVQPGVWYSAHAAYKVDPGKGAPTFDPKFDSPSIRKTHSVDHAKSAPVTRKTFQNILPSSSQVLHKASINNAPLGSQSTPLRPNPEANKRPGPSNYPTPARPPLTTSYRPPTRRSMTVAPNNPPAPSNPNTNVHHNMNGKRPPLSDMTNMSPVPENADVTKKPKVGSASVPTGENQQRQGVRSN
ncbi:DNA repair protein rad52 [Ophidiomyces ophidiicola]|nr:DNA repair protein rad52 [Ophidiomyces ophidiicola]